jgi:hypothetical protein
VQVNAPVAGRAPIFEISSASRDENLLRSNIGISFGTISSAAVLPVDRESVVGSVQGGIQMTEQPSTEESEKRDSNESIVSVYYWLI